MECFNWMCSFQLEVTFSLGTLVGGVLRNLFWGRFSLYYCIHNIIKYIFNVISLCGLCCLVPLVLCTLIKHNQIMVVSDWYTPTFNREVWSLLWTCLWHIPPLPYITHQSFSGRSCGNCTSYQRLCKTESKKLPRGSPPFSKQHTRTKVGFHYWWKMLDVCSRPSSACESSWFEFNLPLSCVLSSFSTSKGTGKYHFLLYFTRALPCISPRE